MPFTYYTEPTTGTLIATDIVGTERFQQMKVDLGPPGQTLPLTGTVQYGAVVDVTRVQTPVDIYNTAVSPQAVSNSIISVAAGASGAIDGNQITSTKTGSLLKLLVATSVPFKAVLHTVADGVQSPSKGTWITAFTSWDWDAPARNMVTQAEQAGAGFDGFRVVVTNLDVSRSADFYACFYYDES